MDAHMRLSVLFSTNILETMRVEWYILNVKNNPVKIDIPNDLVLQNEGKIFSRQKQTKKDYHNLTCFTRNIK